jgi:hypothetical protein
MITPRPRQSQLMYVTRRCDAKPVAHSQASWAIAQVGGIFDL